MPDRFLDAYDAFLLDVDGVLVRGAEPIDGAVGALARLAEAGRVLLLTNNSTCSRSQHADRLASAGFDIAPEWILPTSYLAARYLLDRVGAVPTWVLGEEGLRIELCEAGHWIAKRPEEADALVVGMDRGIDYDSLAAAYRAVESGAKYIATNEDGTFPVPGGFLPGAGAMVGALRGMGFAPDAVIGKPSPIGFEMALRELDLPAECAVMIGDRLETDILGGRDAGLDTTLVLTGVSTRADIARQGIVPTWVAIDLAAVAEGTAESSGQRIQD
jgi:HAD superfamily hydrolase (TIGR01450 family)